MARLLSALWALLLVPATAVAASAGPDEAAYFDATVPH